MLISLRTKHIIMPILFIILIGYYLEVPSSVYTSKVEAIGCIIISLVLTYRCRNSIPLFVGMIFITYCIYSIAIGEYIVGGSLAAPMTEIKNVEIYGENIRILLFFLFTILMFFPARINKIALPDPKDNFLIFYVLILMLIIIGVFGVNRSSTSGYTVNISPIYEYSSIVFIFSYYTSGNKLNRKMIIGIMMVLFILQDYYYGGRITSLQIMILALCTLLKGKFTNLQVLFFSFCGVLLNVIVGSYRVLYSLHEINVAVIFNNLKTNLFVFDTPIYAFYASGTHIATINYFSIPTSLRLNSFIDFFKSIFLGSDNILGNVTLFVKENYFSNEGGGLFPSHFYFWGGWLGVFIGSMIIVFIFNRFFFSNNELVQIINVIIIATIPRWFIYSPLILFRSIFLVCIMYYIYTLSNKFIISSLKRK